MTDQTQLDALASLVDRIRQDNQDSRDSVAIAAEYLRLYEGGIVHRVEPQIRRRLRKELRGKGVREIMQALGIRKRRALQIAGGH